MSAGYCSTADIAHILNLDPKTIRRWCKAGNVKDAFRTRGGHWRIRGEAKPAAQRVAVVKGILARQIRENFGDWEKEKWRDDVLTEVASYMFAAEATDSDLSDSESVIDYGLLEPDPELNNTEHHTEVQNIRTAISQNPRYYFLLGIAREAVRSANNLTCELLAESLGKSRSWTRDFFGDNVSLVIERVMLEERRRHEGRSVQNLNPEATRKDGKSPHFDETERRALEDRFAAEIDERNGWA